MLRLPLAASMFLRWVAAAACIAAALLAVIQPETDVRDAADLPALIAAHRIHPRDTVTSLHLGLELERSGDLAQAETILLDATQFDRQYQPAWTLANFYFRRSNPEQFWVWAARAVDLAADSRPLLRLANRLSSDPRALIARLGDRPEVLRPYLDLLIGESRLEDAHEVATLLRAHNDPADLPRFEALRTIRSAPRH
jgi:hypothetical protein